MSTSKLAIHLPLIELIFSLRRILMDISFWLACSIIIVEFEQLMAILISFMTQTLLIQAVSQRLSYRQFSSFNHPVQFYDKEQQRKLWRLFYDVSIFVIFAWTFTLEQCPVGLKMQWNATKSYWRSFTAQCLHFPAQNGCKKTTDFPCKRVRARREQ